MPEGARVWLIPDAYIPEGSTGEQISHESICVLNSSLEEAALTVSYFFEDRAPIKDLRVTVGAERTRHIRTDSLAPVPKGVPYAIRVESTVPVTVQYSRLDSSQAALTLMTTMAHPID